jgi:hypothetical protein
MDDEELQALVREDGTLKEGSVQAKTAGAMRWRRRWAALSRHELTVGADNTAQPETVLSFADGTAATEDSAELEVCVRNGAEWKPAVYLRLGTVAEKAAWFRMLTAVCDHAKERVREQEKEKLRAQPSTAVPSAASVVTTVVQASAGVSAARVQAIRAMLQDKGVIKRGTLAVKWGGVMWRKRFVELDVDELRIAVTDKNPWDTFFSLREWNVTEAPRGSGSDEELTVRVGQRSVTFKAASAADRLDWITVLELINVHHEERRKKEK